MLNLYIAFLFFIYGLWPENIVVFNSIALFQTQQYNMHTSST